MARVRIMFRHTLRASVAEYVATLGRDTATARRNWESLLQEVQTLFDNSEGMPPVCIPDGESAGIHWLVISPFFQLAFVVVEPQPVESARWRLFRWLLKRKPRPIRKIKIVRMRWLPRPVPE
jgi:hypothetical protein